jgi:hypothetical protein
MIGLVMTAAFALGMAALGVVASLLPRPASRLYGVPVDTPSAAAWVRAAGLRDLGLATALAVLLLHGQLSAAGVVSIATGLVAVTDVVNVVGARGPSPIWPLGTHLSGIAVGVGGGLLLLVGR